MMERGQSYGDGSPADELLETVRDWLVERV